jgi:hypothetical protein
MFNLEQAITKWKQQMNAGGIKDPAVLDELESHLREEIERQSRAGTNEERAFAAAAEKIGPANALKTEFRKNGSGSLPEKLMLAIAVLVAAFGVFLTSVTLLFCYSGWGERLVGFVALGFILLAIFGWSRFTPRLPVIPNKHKRLAIELACFFGGFGICTLYMQLIVRHFERPNEILPVMAFWGLIPIAIGIGLAKAIEEAARRSSTPLKA